MPEVASGGHDHGARRIVGSHEGLEVRPLQAADGGRGPDDRPPERMPRELRRVEKVMHQLGRLVSVHGPFLEDDVALPVDVGRVQTRMQQHVHEDVEEHGQVGRGGAGVKAGMFLVGEGVEVAADALDGLGDGGGGPPTRALEHQVLDEVGDAPQPGGLVSAADPHPQANGDGRHVGHLGRDDMASIGKRGVVVHGWLRGFRPWPWKGPSGGRRSMATRPVRPSSSTGPVGAGASATGGLPAGTGAGRCDAG